MFIVSKRNIILPGPDGHKFRIPKDYMGEAPAWAAKSDYFKALVKDGKIVISKSKKDKDIQAAEESPEAPGGDSE